jgi:hypothetical protein
MKTQITNSIFVVVHLAEQDFERALIFGRVIFPPE